MIYVGITGTSGISFVQKENMQFQVYPNPAHNFILVKSENQLPGLKYFVADQTGRQVLSGWINQGITTINTENLKTGNYFIQIGNTQKQFIKIK